MPQTIHVRVKHIRAGLGGDCFRCAVALALQEATGDDEANVYEDDYLTRLEVHGRSVVAPGEVRQYVWNYDAAPRLADGRPALAARLPERLRPFSFEIPDQNDPEWDERCYGCDEYFKADELDCEGCCGECHAKLAVP